MKIAFSPALCQDMDFDFAVSLAKSCSFDGIELRVGIIPAVSDIEISAVAIDSGLDQLPQAITLAAEVKSRFVRMRSDSLFTRSGGTPSGTIAKLISFADTAAGAGVSILLENQTIFGSALRLWHLLDRLNHPSIACCWNTMSAAQAGDAPAVAVPMLNSRIRYVLLQDARKVGTAYAPCNLGDGDLQLRKTTNRLQGIGFQGYLMIATRQTTGPGADQLEQSLLAARTMLQQWQVLPTTVSN